MRSSTMITNFESAQQVLTMADDERNEDGIRADYANQRAVPLDSRNDLDWELKHRSQVNRKCVFRLRAALLLVSKMG